MKNSLISQFVCLTLIAANNYHFIKNNNKIYLSISAESYFLDRIHSRWISKKVSKRDGPLVRSSKFLRCQALKKVHQVKSKIISRKFKTFFRLYLTEAIMSLIDCNVSIIIFFSVIYFKTREQKNTQSSRGGLTTYVHLS